MFEKIPGNKESKSEPGIDKNSIPGSCPYCGGQNLHSVAMNRNDYDYENFVGCTDCLALDFAPKLTGVRVTPGVEKMLKGPAGPVIQTRDLGATVDTHQPILTVGDVVTKILNAEKYEISLAIIDGKTKRDQTVDVPLYTKKILHCTNYPGTISIYLMGLIELCLKSMEPKIIMVEGEEDLAVIPMIIHAPMGAQILYGVPDKGMCYLTVDSNLKNTALQIMHKMESY